jgi:hypothetical protein
MTDEVKATIGNIIERWGFPVLVALAAGYVLRHDVLLPLVDEHRSFVKNLGETQREISQAIQEQTRLLYALQHPVTRTAPVKVEVQDP